MALNRAKVHEFLYFIFLAGLAISIPISNFLMSLFTILLATNWLIEGDFKRKFENREQNLIVLCFIVPYLVHLIWMIGTSDVAYGLDDLRKKLPLLVIPFIIITSRHLTLRRYQMILTLYIICVFVASVFSFITYSLKDGAEYRNMVWFISHIRFALNVVFAISILFLEIIRIYREKRFNYKYQIIIYLMIILWFIVFLIILRSYTAFGILFILSLIFVIRCLWDKGIRKRIKYFVGILYFGLIAIFIGYETYLIIDYHTPKGISKEPLKVYTAKGNQYAHARDGFIENGYYVNDNIAEQELREAWNEKGYRSLDKHTDNGNEMYATLIRYLNSKGLPKDAEGLEQLTINDINNITYGYANYLAAKKISLKYPTYQLLFEIDLYKKGGYYLYSSLLQRLHLWKNSIQVIKSNPLFGVGTGDVPSAVSEQLIADNSLLKNTSLRAHNQYITFVISFGVIGFLIIAYAYYFIIKRTRIKKHYLFFIFLIILLYSMIGEDTLETQAGVTLFSFFFAFLVKMSDYDKEDISKLFYKKNKSLKT